MIFIKLRTFGGPLLLGHRGARYVRAIPENTIPSFDRALADGCDGFEFDVRLTQDGKGVICHDPGWAGRRIARSTVKQLRGIPLFEDILERYHKRAFLDIELKVEGLEKVTLNLLEKYPPRRGYIVSSFLPRVIQLLRRRDAKMRLGLICETSTQLDRWEDVSCQYLILHYKLLSPRLIGRLQEADREVLVWTVNTTYNISRFASWGVDGIISDQTRRLCGVPTG